MKYRELDTDGDYALGRGRFLFGAQAVAQAVRTRMYLLYGEWWENTEDGLPLFEKILGRYGGEEARNAVDLIIGQRIRGTRGVTKITRFESRLESRVYSANCVVETEFGEITLNVEDNGKKLEVNY